MARTSAEPYRDIDFEGATRGAAVRPSGGKTKISIRLDNAVLEHFRLRAEAAGGGSYQSMINDALVAFIHQTSVLAAARRAIREELARAGVVGRAARPGGSRRGTVAA